MTPRTLRFVATECGSHVSGGVLQCGASNSKSRAAWHSLIFVEDDDGPPYFELDDQSQGGTGAVKRVTLADSLLAIEFVRGKKNPTRFAAVDVDLSGCPAREIAQLGRALVKVFRGEPERVKLAASPRARRKER